MGPRCDAGKLEYVAAIGSMSPLSATQPFTDLKTDAALWLRLISTLFGFG
jgi:hypothetical protein